MIRSFVLNGTKAVPVEVVMGQADQPFAIVGVPATSAREIAVRVRAALERAEIAVPQRTVFVHPIATGVRPMPASNLDLAVALAIAIDAGVAGLGTLDGAVVAGELGLDGAVRPVRGALAAALLCSRQDVPVILPADSAQEAAHIEAARVYTTLGFSELVAALSGIGASDTPSLVRARAAWADPAAELHPDMSGIRGQQLAIAALETALAKRHNILFVGPPGIGKTMIARRIPSLLPPLSRLDQVEASLPYSAVGLLESGRLITHRPFRAPHHSASLVAICGGGPHRRPGEIDLARFGVLFLDETLEFRRETLNALRGKLSDTTSLVGAVSPCPCGWHGSEHRSCVCNESAIARYRERMTRLHFDQLFQTRIHLPHVSMASLRDGEAAEPSAVIRARIIAARKETS